jgi:hypothetical protein
VDGTKYREKRLPPSLYKKKRKKILKTALVGQRHLSSVALLSKVQALDVRHLYVRVLVSCLFKHIDSIFEHCDH